MTTLSITGLETESRRGRVAGKVAIVSGASSGMGFSHVRALALEGARVVGFARRDGLGPALVDEFGPERVTFVHGDVTSLNDWRRVVAQAEDAYGPVSVLINNAGVFKANRVDTVEEDEYRFTVEVNQFGSYFGMTTVIPSMRRAGGGSIINVSSTAGLVGYVDNFAYAASKFAVRGMTRAAALDLAREGIRVNCICPSEVDTPMVNQMDAPEGAVTAPEDSILGRWAHPEEISAAAIFLASDESSYMTGNDLVLDGGYTSA